MSMRKPWSRLAILLVAGAGFLAAASSAEEVTDTRYRAQVHTELGAAYFARGQMAVALEELNEALRSDSGYGPAYNILGLVYMELREDGKAEDSFRRALSINSADSDAHNNYGWFLCQRGKIDESIEQFMAALKNPLYTTPDKSYLNAGICSRMKNNDATAEDFLLKALKLQPQQPQALFHLAEINFKRGSLLDAKSYITRFSRLAPSTAESLWLGVRIERKLGDRNAEASYGLQLRKNFPDSPEAMALLSGKYE